MFKDAEALPGKHWLTAAFLHVYVFECVFLSSSLMFTVIWSQTDLSCLPVSLAKRFPPKKTAEVLMIL